MSQLRQASIREALEFVRKASRSDYLGFPANAAAEMDEAAAKLAAALEPAPHLLPCPRCGKRWT